jgi:GntR family transcriptional regulator/MocR family aminotransferase
MMAYRTSIVDGSLRPGQRIPSTRVLASELGVSRFPVLNAYAQLLAEGYFESRVGAGTVVSSSIPEQLTSSAPTGPRFTSGRSGPRPCARRCSILPPFEGRPWQSSWGAFVVGQVALNRFSLQIWGEAGMHLTVTLKSVGSDMEIAGRAARQKLWLWPLSPS